MKMQKKLKVILAIFVMIVSFSGIAQAGWIEGTVTGVTHTGTYIKIEITRLSDSAIFDYRVDTSLDASVQREMLALALTALSLDTSVLALLDVSSSPYKWTAISSFK